jgi:adenosine deaminase
MNQNVSIAALPKAVLHDHLDGGLRVSTVLELADRVGYRALPTTDPDGLAQWFNQGDSGSLERYLEAFTHTAGVMQTADALERVAFEAVEDLAEDGVVYAEVRFGPALHTAGDLQLEGVVEAVLAGLDRGRRATGLRVGLIPSALRNAPNSELVARATARFVGEGVVGFDLAGPEAGYPPDDHLPAFRLIHDAGLGLTIHAGEGDGPNSIFRAIARCGAQRIGHGVHIVDDAVLADGQISELGALATRIHDEQIPLEVAVRSNVHTAFVPDAASHPFGALYRAGFNVSINTDNRLMSNVTMSDEYASALNDQAMTLDDLGAITESAIRAGFGAWDERKRIIDDVVKPAYAGVSD